LARRIDLRIGNHFADRGPAAGLIQPVNKELIFCLI